jgi:hypothetical protein
MLFSLFILLVFFFWGPLSGKKNSWFELFVAKKRLKSPAMQSSSQAQLNCKEPDGAGDRFELAAMQLRGCRNKFPWQVIPMWRVIQMIGFPAV